MKRNLNLIVMLTHYDKTVNRAYEIFEQCKNTKAEFFGFKEEPLPLTEMKALYEYMRRCGKKTALEVVAYTEAEGIDGAKKALECHCDILMGTMYFDSINEICKEHHLLYMPFVGTVTERPSVLDGNIEDIIREANQLVHKGVYGFDLLGYRFTGNAADLNRQFVSLVGAPVCIAGSVNSYQRLDELKAAKPWAFTIGSAFFENKFGDDICEQIDTVCDYMEEYGME